MSKRRVWESSELVDVGASICLLVFIVEEEKIV